MFSLNQSVIVKGSAGEPLSTPFEGLRKLEVEFRRGSFSVVCAAGGTGKSLLGLSIALWSGAPCLYFSADSTASVQLSRATAMITGTPAKTIRDLISTGGSFDEYQDALGQKMWLRFCYNARPTPADIELHLKAYQEAFGCFPHLIVVDNITNVDTGGGMSASDFTFGLEGLCDYFSEVARETSAHVMCMHHVIGEYSSGNVPVPLSGIKGKIARVPALVLTVHAEVDSMGGRVLNVAPTKNREGFADPSGTTYASFTVDPANLRISDLEDPVF